MASRLSTRYSLNKNKFLLPPELDRLKSILSTYVSQNPRDCHLMEIALRTGARAQEVLNIHKSDLNAYDQTVLIRGIKGSNDREIPLHSNYFQLLENYVSTVSGAKIFQISYPRLHQIWNFYRPVHKKFHSLRHTFAIELFRKTKDLRLVQVALGHRNIMNTMIYADYVYSREELRKLIVEIN